MNELSTETVLLGAYYYSSVFYIDAPIYNPSLVPYRVEKTTTISVI